MHQGGDLGLGNLLPVARGGEALKLLLLAPKAAAAGPLAGGAAGDQAGHGGLDLGGQSCQHLLYQLLAPHVPGSFSLGLGSSLGGSLSFSSSLGIESSLLGSKLL